MALYQAVALVKDTDTVFTARGTLNKDCAATRQNCCSTLTLVSWRAISYGPTRFSTPLRAKPGKTLLSAQLTVQHTFRLQS